MRKIATSHLIVAIGCLTSTMLTLPRALAKSPATAPATTQTAVRSVGEVDRIYKKTVDDAKLQYQRALAAARQGRIRELEALQDKAMGAKDVKRLLEIHESIAAAKAEAQSDLPEADQTTERAHSPIVLRIVGKIDGHDMLIIRQDGAMWHQMEFGPPENLALNGVAWNVSRSDSLRNSGSSKFLPAPVNFRTGALVKKSGRNLVEAQADDDELRIFFNDTDPGAGHYDLTFEFQPQIISAERKNKSK
jgi:hypothetical protein